VEVEEMRSVSEERKTRCTMTLGGRELFLEFGEEWTEDPRWKQR